MAGCPFQRMQERLFAGRLAQEALLRGQPLRIMVDDGVQMVGEYGESAGTRTVVTFPSLSAPRVGDAVEFDDRRCLVDHIESDDGHFVSCIVRPA